MSEPSRQIGPTLPPNFKNNSNSDDDDECFGPALLNDQQQKHSDDFNNSTDSYDSAFGPTLPPGFASSSKADRPIGPTLPGDFVTENGEEEEEDDTFGPVPEGQEDKNHLYDVSQRKYKKNDKNITKREKWMLTPGKALAKTLQTKSIMQFNQKSAKKDAPLTKEQKLELAEKSEKEGKMKEFLEQYEKSNKRDVSLLDQHRNDQKRNKKLKSEKTERREFDRDTDLFARQVDHKKKSSFIKEASTTFTGRFSSGKFEKFL